MNRNVLNLITKPNLFRERAQLREKEFLMSRKIYSEFTTAGFANELQLFKLFKMIFLVILLFFYFSNYVGVIKLRDSKIRIKKFLSLGLKNLGLKFSEKISG